MASLADFYDYVCPCFPEALSPLHVAVRVFSSRLSATLDYLGHCARGYDVQSLLHLIKWAATYKATLHGKGGDGGRGGGLW